MNNKDAPSSVDPHSETRNDAPPSVLERIRRSFSDSVGSIVFGMEDGTVSIFGLVFGVAAVAPDSHAVLLAGGTGAVAAAVSMMAGTYLDVESTNDRATAQLAEEQKRFDDDRSGQDRSIHERLLSAGFSDSEATTVIDVVGKHPDVGVEIASALDLGITDNTRESPIVQSAWMFITDLFAALVPVFPFAVFALATARIVSVSLTLVLLIALGVGRSVIGHRKLLPTVAETIGIAAAAAAAGVLAGKLIS